MSKLLRDIIFRTLTEIKGDNCDVLAVFDFDDTLVTSDSQVVVTHQNGKSEELSSSEYAMYVEQPGDEFDYSQFNDTTTAKSTSGGRTVLRGPRGTWVPRELPTTPEVRESEGKLHVTPCQSN